MAEYTIVMDPSSAHPSSSLTAKYVESGTQGNTTLSGLRVGFSDSGSGEKIYGLLYGTLPIKEDIFGEGVTDPNLEITGLKFVFDPSTDDETGGKYAAIRELKQRPGITAEPPTFNNLAYNPVDGTETAAGMTYGHAIIGDSARGTIDKSVGTDVLGFVHVPTTSTDQELAVDFDKKSYTWGDNFSFVVTPELATADVDAYFHVNTADIALHITYNDPEPSAPVIKLEADTDYRSAVVTMTTIPSDPDILSYATIWKHDSVDSPGNKTGLYYKGSGGYNRTVITSGNVFSDGIFKEVNGDITDGFLNTTGERDYLVVYANDQNATGEHGTSTVQNRTMSNAVSHARMECTATLSAGTAIGQELTVTINGIVGDGDSTAKTFSKYAVHWDNPTSTGGVIENFNIVTLDSPVSSVSITHTYDKAGDYDVMVCVIDSAGFRSDFVRAGGATRTIVESNPVAVLRSSRDTALRARYGDEFSVINLSLSHSYPVGSDRLLMTHKFKHNSTRPITTFPMDNDNSKFNDASTSVAVKCNKASCDDTVIKVFGKVSVDSDGDPIADDHVNFDHYEFQVNSVSPHTNIDTLGGVATTTDSGGSTVAVYYKQVDFVVISTLSGDDDGVLYTLVDIKDDHNSGDAADSGFGNVINNKIRGKKDTYAWGGYEVLTTSITELNFNAGAKTITRDAGGGDFITNGAAVGDTIYIAGPEDAENNGFFTLSAVTGTVLTVNEDITTNTADTAATIYKVGPSVLPIAAYDGTQATITASVVSTVEGQSTTANLDTSSEVTQDILIINESQNTLDLDTMADAGDIAILSASLSRSGGIASQMPLGNKIYPTGAIRTHMGDPTVALNVRAITQTGYRKLWNLIEGGRYEWTTIDSKKVDVPATAYKQLRMRLVNGSLDKDPSMTSQYTGTLNFVVIGELVT